jgi:2-polyprenyl-3-methyl-5-hydroxy-6-metoxy-1,4-benzoquinol methylase
MTRAPDSPDPSSREYYERSDYFQGGGSHLLNPESRFHRYRARMVRELCGSLEGVRAVDLGCGWGTIAFALAREAREVVGVDFAQAAVDICRERLEQEPRENLRFVRADARTTGLPGGKWGLVVAADLVEHLPADVTLDVYREAHRLLRPGGHLVIWTPDPGHFTERLRTWGVLRPDPTHVDYKTLGRVVRELEAQGFVVEEAGHRESHLPFLGLLERLTLRWSPLMRRRIAVRARKG